MTNSFYNVSGAPVTGSTGSSAIVRGEFANIAAAFDKMPALTADYVVVVNSGGTALTVNAKTGTGSVVFDTSPNFTGPVGIGMSPSNVLDITQTQNAASIAQIYNNSAGAAAQAMFRAINNSSKQMLMGVLSSGFTTSGVFIANRSLLYSTGAAAIITNDEMVFSVDGGVTERARLNASGFGIGMTPTNILDITQSQNADTKCSVINANAGVSARAMWQVGNGSGNSTFLFHYGTGYTTAGVNRQDGGQVYSNGAGGLTIATGVAQPIYFGIDGTAAMRLSSTGLSVGTSVSSSTHLRDNIGFGTSIAVSTQATVSAGATLSITAADGGGYSPGLLVVSSARVSNATFRTSTFYAIHLRGTTIDAANVLSTANGSGGASGFTLDYTSSGVIRVTDTSGQQCIITITFIGHSGG